MAEVARLGRGRHRSRGSFWVPSRPDSVCVRDGAGGQLSVGALGAWGRRAAATRLVLTGVEDVRADLLAAFEDVLLTTDEHARGLHPWLGADDVLAPWLGDRDRPRRRGWIRSCGRARRVRPGGSTGGTGPGGLRMHGAAPRGIVDGVGRRPERGGRHAAP